MVMDDQAKVPARGLAFRAAAVLLALFSLSAAGFFMLRGMRPPEGEQAPGASAPAPSRFFAHWPKNAKPELVVLLSGEQHGYLQPCGCSSPQYGGLERRYNLVHQLMKDRGWQFTALDVGDIAQERGVQAILKYVTSMKALKVLDYAAVGLGLNEINLSLIDVLGEYALNNPKPQVLAANLDRKEWGDLGVGDAKVVGEGALPRLGVVGVVGSSVIKKVQNPNVKFPQGNTEVLKAQLKKLAGQKVDLRVLLYFGSIAEARKAAQTFPEFNVIVCSAFDAEPPSEPERVGNTLIITTGQKGKYVGLLGIYKTGNPQKPFDLHYEIVLLGPEYETPETQLKGHPIAQLMEEYAKTVRDKDYLSKYGKKKHIMQVTPPYTTAEYVGTEKCKKCHDESYKVWAKSKHAHAYQSLVEAKRPSLRQFDGECVVCHVVGFEYTSGFANEKATPNLKNVGCESCHGPGSLHVKNQNVNKTDKKLNELMNPFRAPPNENQQQKDARLLRLQDACRQCHDLDNDVHWDSKTWQENRWKPVEHYEKDLRQAAQATP